MADCTQKTPFRIRARKQTTKRKDTVIMWTIRELHPVTKDVPSSEEKLNPVHEDTPSEIFDK
jgi:hypothetical protein